MLELKGCTITPSSIINFLFSLGKDWLLLMHFLPSEFAVCMGTDWAKKKLVALYKKNDFCMEDCCSIVELTWDLQGPRSLALLKRKFWRRSSHLGSV